MSTEVTKGLDPLAVTIVGQTDFDFTIEQCLVSDRNPACAVLIRSRHRSTVKTKSVCSHSNCAFCPIVLGQCMIVVGAVYY